MYSASNLLWDAEVYLVNRYPRIRYPLNCDHPDYPIRLACQLLQSAEELCLIAGNGYLEKVDGEWTVKTRK